MNEHEPSFKSLMNILRTAVLTEKMVMNKHNTV